jgi:hypothetical protein
MPKHVPTVKTLLVADDVFRKEDRKWCVIGIFQVIKCRNFPNLHRSMGLLMLLTDGEGDFRMRVEFADSEGRTVARLEGTLAMRNRLDEVWVGIRGDSLMLPSPGKYFFRIYFDDTLSTFDAPIKVELMESQ